MPPFEFRGNGKGRDRRSRPKQEFTFRYPRPHISERPLLSSKAVPTGEQFVGEQEKQAPKFTSWEDLSDSEEAEMDLSTDEDGADETSRPRKKRAVGLDGVESPAPAPPAPKWSNPDPYTALPPPDESREKRVDVVKLIRKAKIAANASKPDETNEVTENQDFISFGDMGIDDEPPNNAPENAPRGPNGMTRGESALASRKRTHDDELKGYSKKTGKPASKFYYDASILDQWRALSHQFPAPWMDQTAPALNMGTR
jgi:non-canonical poly(A) RNA polymerase PAPD5/7